MLVRTLKDRVVEVSNRNPELLAIMEDAGLFTREPVASTPEKPELTYEPNAVWTVGRTLRGNHAIINVRCSGCGLDEDLHTLGSVGWRLSHCRGAGSDPIPAAVRKEFLELEERVQA